jgi:nitrous oxide reductase accessory protein NosL
MELNTERKVTQVTVGDFITKEQIDADTACWVIGGNRMGVMTSRAKWAFENKDSAEKFIAGSGGRLVTYEEALKTAFEDMYEDRLTIQEKRRLFNLPKNRSMIAL